MDDVTPVPATTHNTAELVARLRDYDNCHDGDVDDAADHLEYLQKIIDEIPALIELVAQDCGKEYIDRPSIYQRGRQWRYHKVRAGNQWNDADTPLLAAQNLDRISGEAE
jgi:hypothetical protein